MKKLSLRLVVAMRRITSALLMLICVVVLPTFAAPQDGQRIIRLGTFSKAVDYAPYLVAKQKHLFDAALKPYNAKASFEEFQTLPTINEAFASKKLDAVFEAEAPCIVGRAAGIDLKIVGISAVVDVPVVVHKDSGIRKLSDLKGKKVAVLAGTSAHYVLLKLLERAGLNKNDVSIVDMTPPDAKSAFDSNKLDGWAIWPPFPEQEELAGTGVTIPKASGKVVVIMVARSDFIKNDPKIAKALVSVLNSTRQWVSSHPSESQKIVADELKIPLAVVQRAWTRQDWKATIDQSVLTDIQNKADFLKSVGFVRTNVAVKSLVQQPAL
jgi:sulfonate transport system substrate-binding protein